MQNTSAKTAKSYELHREKCMQIMHRHYFVNASKQQIADREAECIETATDGLVHTLANHSARKL